MKNWFEALSANKEFRERGLLNIIWFFRQEHSIEMALSKTQELVQKALKDPCIFGVILHSEGDYWTRQMTESQLKTQALYQKFVWLVNSFTIYPNSTRENRVSTQKTPNNLTPRRLNDWNCIIANGIFEQLHGDTKVNYESLRTATEKYNKIRANIGGSSTELQQMFYSGNWGTLPHYLYCTPAFFVTLHEFIQEKFKGEKVA